MDTSDNGAVFNISKYDNVDNIDELDNSDSDNSDSDNSDISSNIPTIRYFRLFDPITGTRYGRYTGYTPIQAARKIYIYLLQEGKINPDDKTICIQETTRGCSRKKFIYNR